MDINKLTDFLDKIGFAEETSSAILCYCKKHRRFIDFLVARYLSRKSRKGLNMLSYLTRLAVVSCIAEQKHADYLCKGLADSVYYDTFRDIVVWAENCLLLHKKVGLENVNWLNNHLNLELFRIGRLQFQFSTFSVPLGYTVTDNADLPKTFSPAVFVHIPRGERLDYEKCKQSIVEAKDFLRRFYPEYADCVMYTNTWLLYPKNTDFMDENSNIVRFMSLFRVVAETRQNTDAFSYLWYAEGKEPLAFSENTSLRKRAKAYLLCGGNFGLGVGIVKPF